MKKSVFLFFILGSFSGLVSAQTNIQLYGIVDAGVSWTDKGNGKTFSLDDGNLSASRFGLRGTENLGSGLSSHFVLEQGFNTDTGEPANPAAQFSRLAYLGIVSDFGTVRLGRQNAPLKEALDVIDPFAGAGLLATFGTFNYIPREVSFGASSGGWPARLSNQLTYIFSKFGNFSGEVAYNFGETPGKTKENHQYGMQIGYLNGPVNVQIGFHKSYKKESPGDINSRMFLIGSTYTFPVVKLHVAIGDTRNKVNAVADPIIKIRNYLLGATIPLGASTIVTSVTHNDVRDAVDANATQFGIAYLYDLSKRTTFYAQYAHARNGDVSDFNVSEPSKEGKHLVVGLRHKF